VLKIISAPSDDESLDSLSPTHLAKRKSQSNQTHLSCLFLCLSGCDFVTVNAIVVLVVLSITWGEYKPSEVRNEFHSFCNSQSFHILLSSGD